MKPITACYGKHIEGSTTMTGYKQNIRANRILGGPLQH